MNKDIEELPDVKKDTIKIKYCTNSTPKEIKPKSKTEDNKAGPPKETEKELDFSIKTKWKIRNFHDPNGKIISGTLAIKKYNKFSDETKLKDILNNFCLHPADQEKVDKTSKRF